MATMTTHINVAILGVGFMGQEHISYMQKYDKIKIKFICDTSSQMIEKTLSLISSNKKPEVFLDENELIKRVNEIDLLVIATPNFMHTPQLLKWAKYPLCILVEKPVAISEKQIMALRAAKDFFNANIWVAMEYRYIPAVQKLYQLLPSVGQIKNISIRENRFPFLSKVDEWNKDIDKSGDTLVEKCCHFFDLFRLISKQEMKSCITSVLRGVLRHEYGYDVRTDNPTPMIDSAHVLLHLGNDCNSDAVNETKGCLELCMFADGSRHQEEIIVTGTKGRLEAYLPENKVFQFTRPKESEWIDRTQPPPRESIKEEIIDCSKLSTVYTFANDIPQHSGHHYCSTAIEWKFLIDEITKWQHGGLFIPQVSLDDGIEAVSMGITAQSNIFSSNGCNVDQKPLVAFSTKSCDQLLNLAIGRDLTKITTSFKGISPHIVMKSDDFKPTIGREEQKGP